MIENACPFAPGEVKPESMPVKKEHTQGLRQLVNKKMIFLVLTLVALTLMYIKSYPSLSYEGSNVLFQDWYIVKMSFYTYLMGMISYFIRRYREQEET